MSAKPDDSELTRSPERKPRVAWVALAPTPYHIAFFESLHELGELDIQFYFCAPQHASQRWLLEVSDDLNVAVPEARRIPLVSAGRAHRYWNPGIVKALVRQPWDIVVVAGYAHPTMQLAILACLLRRIPLMIHSDSHLLKRRHWVKRLAKRLVLFPVLRRCSAGLGWGVLVKRYWESVGIPENRTFVVPLISHLDSFRDGSVGNAVDRLRVRGQLGISREAVVGIFVGRLVRRKGVDLLLEGLAKMDPARRPHLVIAGDGPERTSLEQFSAERSLPVTFAGFRQNHELPVLYAASDFFMLSSREEPWGIVVAEAMASGLPVVLSDQVGAAYDLLDDGRNGFLVRGNSAEAWRGALERCAGEEEKLKVMGNQSRSIIRHWTKEASAKQFLRAVELCLAGKDKHRFTSRR